MRFNVFQNDKNSTIYVSECIICIKNSAIVVGFWIKMIKYNAYTRIIEFNSIEDSV